MFFIIPPVVMIPKYSPLPTMMTTNAVNASLLGAAHAQEKKDPLKKKRAKKNRG